ncbi:DUF5072 family protein [Alkalihalobacillus trypoxylicola]|uniref:DUF5072 domain-containing protein n=1 Tax=Alkalihalobacillus trypoxylicola TaxID=519424 RepID=A0A161Q1R4_9BACI|nr:DUF5072 family protein [Alkalihalobacillus trypoxylicola]KYG34911.1 hypothetical protein AZF04_00840 [Alkalihalobacillus trypoxylicola]
MLKKLSILDMHVALKNKIEANTHLKCIDNVGVNEPSPFTFLEIVGMTEKNTKTMYVDEYIIHVHVISEPSNSSIGHYANISSVQEALTEYIRLPDGFELFKQASSGLISNYIEKETNERHAVLGFIFNVSYGFKIKI